MEINDMEWDIYWDIDTIHRIGGPMDLEGLVLWLQDARGKVTLFEGEICFFWLSPVAKKKTFGKFPRFMSGFLKFVFFFDSSRKRPLDMMLDGRSAFVFPL